MESQNENLNIEQIIRLVNEHPDLYQFQLREYVSIDGAYSIEAMVPMPIGSFKCGIIFQEDAINPSLTYRVEELTKILHEYNRRAEVLKEQLKDIDIKY